MKKIFVVILFYFVGLILLNVLTRYFIFDRTNYELYAEYKFPLYQLIFPLTNFDGLNYLDISKNGYSLSNVVFFPLFPILVKILSLNGLLNTVLIGFSLNLFLATSASYSLYNLIKNNEGHKIAFRSLVLFLVFPTSFFLLSFYTEALFFLLSILFFINLEKKNFFICAVLAMLTSLTKIFGVLLIVLLIFEAIKNYKKIYKFPWVIFIAPLGIFSWILFLAIKFGDPFVFIKMQESSRFSREVSFFSPLNLFKDSLEKISLGPQNGYDSPFVYPVILIEVLTIIYAVLLLYLSYRKISLNYWLYGLLYVLLIIYSGGLSSDLRYLLMVFPFFIYLGKTLSYTLFKIWVSASFLLMLFLASLFIRNYWVG